jgi:hypothetical protein
MAFAIIISLILGVLGLYIVKVNLFPQKRQALPPGPKPKFLIGNLLDLPKRGEVEYMHWLKHRDLYGPFIILEIQSSIVTSFVNRSNQFSYDHGSDIDHSQRLPTDM